MTILHQLRQVALRAGFDVERKEATAPGRLSQLLRGWGVNCVLDIGANHGQYGKQLRYFGYGGALRSFEPIPDAYKSLAAHAAHDPHWSVWNIALGGVDETISLNVAGNKGAASSSVLPMLPRHKEAAPDSSYVRAIDVDMRRLDAIWDEVVPPGSTPFMKVDVQGFEGSVLDGAAKSLTNVVGVQLEISLVPLYEGAMSLRDALDRTEKLGLQLVHVEPGFHDPRSGELLQLDAVFLRPAVH